MQPTQHIDIQSIKTTSQFEQAAMDLFGYQFEHNAVYRSFCDLLLKHPSDVTSLNDIPFLPIQFFKSHEVLTGGEEVEKVFTSSGTTGAQTSKHLVTDLSLYQQSFLQGFSQVYGDIENYVVLALLPSYLEREGSSLIYMVDRLIKDSKRPESGFYLNNYFALSEKLKELDARGQSVLLIGVSFALLDLVESTKFSLKHTVVLETGGMKGRRKELIREELHAILKEGFGIPYIHSEYGMTELLSQAYSTAHGVFTTPQWMRVLCRDTEDPLSILPPKKTGGINVIDLANRNSCAFIATQDLGKTFSDGSFKVLGRFDNSDIRGCNLMLL